MDIRKGDKAMMKMKLVTAAVTMLGAFALLATSSADASTHRKKKATKRAAITQPLIVNMACEGRVATITSTAFASPSRDENSISFLISINRVSGVANIMRASGSRMIKAGRYAMFANEDGMSVNILWTDNNNQGQTLTLTFRADDAFFGDTQSSQPNNIGVELFRQLLGAEYAPVMDITTRHRVEGSCWQQ
jgi:hypothetical protein